MSYPKVTFREPFEDRAAFEVPLKGWYNGVTVELESGATYQLFFYDPVRLAQDLEASAKIGEPFIAERNMIVVPQITEASIREAVEKLHRQGWFEEANAI